MAEAEHGPSEAAGTVDLCCPCCGQSLSFDGHGHWECDICTVAAREGKSVEAVRADVEELARSFTSRFASAEGKPCTCKDRVGCVHLSGKESSAVISVDDPHEPGCPRSPAPFEWTPIVDEWRPRAFTESSSPDREGA